MSRIQTLLNHYPELDVCRRAVEAAAEALTACYRSGGKLLLCGNGGSAADADHIAGELLKGFQSPRPLPAGLREKLGEDLADGLQMSLPASPLPAFTALGTAYHNDVDAAFTYAQLVLGLGRPGDILLGISTSGNARNVALALRAARGLGLTTLGLTGEHGGALPPLCDICIQAPATETYRIQEYHLPVYHTLCLMVEDALFPPNRD